MDCRGAMTALESAAGRLEAIVDGVGRVGA